MKDINGQILQEGNDIILKAGKKQFSGIISEITSDKMYFDIDGKRAYLKESDVCKYVQKIEMLEEEKQDVKPLLTEMLLNTKPTYIIEEDAFQDIALETLRLKGIGIDKDAKIGLNEEQSRFKRYGRIYDLLKEVYELSTESEETEELAEIISKIASEIKKQL